mmetsp:Transcript_58437/g.187667  ORF Transcript_58437/g.187667 Transcript_58437/m.187667 type:complete len:366 (+) Transcript_58437:92-1189(+)
MRLGVPDAPAPAAAVAEQPLRPAAMGLESEEGPLWNSIRKQLYKSEVSHVKRLVGDSQIQQNKLLWNELTSLRQILADFQEQNDERSESLKQQVRFCGTQHRDLLRRQAQIILEDVRSQAESCGHVLEDLIHELRDHRWREFLLCKDSSHNNSKSELRFSPPATPSTRPSSSSGVSGCSTPEPLTGLPPLPLGRQLGVDELSGVAEGIREALEAEQEALLAAIGEQIQRLEAEDARRVESARGEPSTVELQEFVHKLQDLAVSPSLRTLSLTGPPSPGNSKALDLGGEGLCPPMPISGGANVRRLKALIAQRRLASPPPHQALGAVPEVADAIPAPTLAALVGVPVNGCTGAKPAFDPFFDDPFA